MGLHAPLSKSTWLYTIRSPTISRDLEQSPAIFRNLPRSGCTTTYILVAERADFIVEISILPGIFPRRCGGRVQHVGARLSVPENLNIRPHARAHGLRSPHRIGKITGAQDNSAMNSARSPTKMYAIVSRTISTVSRAISTVSRTISTVSRAISTVSFTTSIVCHAISSVFFSRDIFFSRFFFSRELRPRRRERRGRADGSRRRGELDDQPIVHLAARVVDVHEVLERQR